MLSKKIAVSALTYPMKNLGYKRCVSVIVIFAAVVRCITLTDRYFWCDEASSVLTSRYDVGALLYHASFDVHPPLYYLLLHAWMALFGDSIMAVRSLSLVLGVMTVALTIRLTHRLFNERAALLAGWLMAIMPMAVRYSQEARMYALMGLLILAATMALAMWLKTPNNNRYLALYALLMTLSFYTHYFTVFASVAHWGTIALLSLRRGDGGGYLRRPAWWGMNVMIGVAYIPWLLVLLNLLTHLTELRAGGDVGWISPVAWRDLPAMYFRFFTGSGGLNYPDVVLWLLLASFIYAVCRRQMRSGEAGAYGLLLCNLLIPVMLVFALSWRTPLFIERYVFFASLSTPIVLAILITESKTKGLRIFWTMLFSVLFGIGVCNHYPAEKDGFKALMHDINSQYQPEDVVLVSNMFNYLSYVYYNEQGHHALLYTPPKPDGMSGKPNAYGFGTFFHARAAQTYIENLGALSRNHRRIWLVSGGDFSRDFGGVPAEWVNIGVFKRERFEVRLFVTCIHQNQRAVEISVPRGRYCGSDH